MKNQISEKIEEYIEKILNKDTITIDEVSFLFMYLNYLSIESESDDFVKDLFARMGG